MHMALQQPTVGENQLLSVLLKEGARVDTVDYVSVCMIVHA